MVVMAPMMVVVVPVVVVVVAPVMVVILYLHQWIIGGDRRG